MKYSEEEYKQQVELIYNGELEVVGRYKGLNKPILVKDRYGVMQVLVAHSVLKYKPSILTALNRTEYFMNQLREVHPEIAAMVKPASEYRAMKQKMLFETKCGLVSMYPDALLHGHTPSVRGAIDRKAYMRTQLQMIYDYKYDFIIHSTDRHEGRISLICPVHGEVSVDSCHIFSGCGCPKCNTGWTKSTILYVVRLYSKMESFYKLGVTHRDSSGNLRRFKEYKKLGYSIETLAVVEFDTYEECHDKELALKQLIKDSLYIPNRWSNNSSTECFTENLLELIIKNIS